MKLTILALPDSANKLDMGTALIFLEFSAVETLESLKWKCEKIFPDAFRLDCFCYGRTDQSLENKLGLNHSTFVQIHFIQYP